MPTKPGGVLYSQPFKDYLSHFSVSETKTVASLQKSLNRMITHWSNKGIKAEAFSVHFWY
ncbi:hypothetical protein Closa_2693 [[Clostridium] saccharolyticum WM1]|uniref:Uncharacterized protein n=1 Tax=Lacrimispora saccharolytica (strain ATCC 35040 / DSM 2544 / NRCC 2533 / WM1) TaxID=610130 RepID=D9R5R9_LACSW|nr:hypothetical protein Closa_2693 [[Clostridium] saccharolyticum WM1]